MKPTTQTPTSGLSLIRLAIVRFAPPLPSNELAGEVDGVSISTLFAKAVEDKASDVLLAAKMPLRFRPKITGGNLLVVPERERSQLEQTTEYVANLVAVTEACTRSITSPFPCVALQAHDEATRKWLDGLDGILDVGRMREIPAFSAPIPLSDQSLQTVFEARRDGVALLAEVHAQGHALGRYRDLIRFFERAFAIPASKLAAPLARFLDARYGYTEDEVSRWLTIRDPATHADARKNFALEPDVLPILDRMEQAARDVLLNKAEWRSRTVDRNEIWEPTAWTSSSDGHGVVRQGSKGRVQARLMDTFGIFPTGGGRTLSGIPTDWWCPLPESATTTGTPLKVIAKDA